MRYPARAVYTFRAALPAAYPNLEYPFHDRTITVTRCGRICIGARKINLSKVFAGQNVGIQEIAEQIWLVSFMDYRSGLLRSRDGRVEPSPQPVRRESVNHVSGPLCQGSCRVALVQPWGEMRGHMTKPFSVAFKQKMVQRLTGKNAVSALQLSKETGVRAAEPVAVASGGA